MRLLFIGDIGGVGGPTQSIRFDKPAQEMLTNIQQDTDQSAIKSSSDSMMKTISKTESSQASTKNYINSINTSSRKINQNINKLKFITNEPNAIKVNVDDINKTLMPKAKELYKSSLAVAGETGVEAKGLDAAKKGWDKVLNYVESAQTNLEKAAYETQNNKDTSMANMLSMSTKMNEANSKVYVIVAVARQLVDTVNKLMNAPI